MHTRCVCGPFNLVGTYRVVFLFFRGVHPNPSIVAFSLWGVSTYRAALTGGKTSTRRVVPAVLCVLPLICARRGVRALGGVRRARERPRHLYPAGGRRGGAGDRASLRAEVGDTGRAGETPGYLCTVTDTSMIVESNVQPGGVLYEVGGKKPAPLRAGELRHVGGFCGQRS